MVGSAAGRWLHLVTSQPVAANQWIFVKFGTHDYHSIVSDDMDVESRVKNHWHLEEAQYRTTS
jgi:hypothetical protein